VTLAGVAHAEVQVRLLDRATAADAHRADAIPAADPLPRAHRQRREVEVGGLQPIARRAHGDRETRRSRDVGEGHRAPHRGHDRRAHGGRYVDAAVLPARVRVRRVEQERLEHGTVDRPGPGDRASRGDEDEEDEPKDGAAEKPAHGSPPLLSEWKTERER
jgi:hypothetical protein